MLFMGEVLHCWFLNFYEFVSFDKLRTNGRNKLNYKRAPENLPSTSSGRAQRRSELIFTAKIISPVRPDTSSGSVVNATLSTLVIVPIPFVLSLSKDTNSIKFFFKYKQFQSIISRYIGDNV